MISINPTHPLWIAYWSIAVFFSIIFLGIMILAHWKQVPEQEFPSALTLASCLALWPTGIIALAPLLYNIVREMDQQRQKPQV